MLGKFNGWKCELLRQGSSDLWAAGWGLGVSKITMWLNSQWQMW